MRVSGRAQFCSIYFLLARRAASTTEHAMAPFQIAVERPGPGASADFENVSLGDGNHTSSRYDGFESHRWYYLFVHATSMLKG